MSVFLGQLHMSSIMPMRSGLRPVGRGGHDSATVEERGGLPHSHTYETELRTAHPRSGWRAATSRTPSPARVATNIVCWRGARRTSRGRGALTKRSGDRAARGDRELRVAGLSAVSRSQRIGRVRRRLSAQATATSRVSIPGGAFDIESVGRVYSLPAHLI